MFKLTGSTLPSATVALPEPRIPLTDPVTFQFTMVSPPPAQTFRSKVSIKMPRLGLEIAKAMVCCCASSW